MTINWVRGRKVGTLAELERRIKVYQASPGKRQTVQAEWMVCAKVQKQRSMKEQSRVRNQQAWDRPRRSKKMTSCREELYPG